MNPKISVIIPVYNEEKYLSDCLDSIINQSLKDIEIICVDDGSTDRSAAILNRYKNNDFRVIVLAQCNQGAGVARNYGLSVAKGEYVAFLDSDDKFDETMLEKMYKAAIRDDLDIIVCRTDRFDNATGVKEEGSWTINDFLLPDHKPFNSLEIANNFFETFVWWPWDKLYKKSFIDQMHIQFQNLRTTNDLFFVCAAVITAKKISYIDDILVHQRSGLNTSLSVTREKSWDNFLKALSKLYEFLKKNNLYHHFERDFINYVLNFSIWHLETLHGQSYCLLFNELKNKWFSYFNVIEHDEEFYYKKENYLRLQYLEKNDAVTYLILVMELLNKTICSREEEIRDCHKIIDERDETICSLNDSIYGLKLKINDMNFEMSILKTGLFGKYNKLKLYYNKNGLISTLKHIQNKL